MGVDMFLPALMISFILGTPRVTFILATPAKWKVFRVIWVPGSPILCAPNAPTVDPTHGNLPSKTACMVTEETLCLCAAGVAGLPETDLSHMSFAAKQERHTWHLKQPHAIWQTRRCWQSIRGCHQMEVKVGGIRCNLKEAVIHSMQKPFACF